MDLVDQGPQLDDMQRSGQEGWSNQDTHLRDVQRNDDKSPSHSTGKL